MCHPSHYKGKLGLIFSLLYEKLTVNPFFVLFFGQKLCFPEKIVFHATTTHLGCPTTGYPKGGL
jgi:hypothetical protein